MKKIIYAILACIFIAGVIITLTMGLKADIIYSKNVEIDIYIGKQVELKEIKAMAKEAGISGYTSMKKDELLSVLNK